MRSLTVLSGLLSSLALACGLLAAESANWPQWRGPDCTGTAPNANPPVEFSETSNVKWKIKLPGSGASTPIIWENKIFIQTAIATGKKPAGSAASEAKPAEPPPAPPEPGRGPGDRRGGGMRGAKPAEIQQFALLCFDRSNGKPLWQKTLREELPHEGHHPDHGFSSHSPVTDGTHVYAWFGSRGLHCLDMDGNVKWSKDLGKMQTRNGFGEGSSPALSGDTIVVNWDHEGEDFVAAFNKKTGDEIWRQPRDENTTWTTPLIVEHGGKKQVVVSASTRIRSYDLASGKEIWSCAGMTANVIPTPLVSGDTVYVTSGFMGAALLAIKLGSAGDLTGTPAITWQHAKRTPYVPSPLLANGRLYFYSGNKAELSCFDAKTGKPFIEAERVPGIGSIGVYSSPAAAADRVYLTGRDGAVVVVKQSDKLEVLATNKLDEAFEASPAIVGKELYLRGHSALYCIAEK
ncbi:MAG TPA: PQQ-binding-like beta-propeller repeat protein [Verrucomicrobiales bacterium]|nr:PQQ-binding-like beta-propeller repeat protein [Verrucomicrobiales bacterium]